MTPDDRDKRILALLQDDAWLSYAAIARRVNLSASAVQRRVERLIESGSILGAKAMLAPDGGERQTTIFLLAELVDDTAATIAQFERAIAFQPEVIEAHYVTGEADVVLRLRVKDIAAYDRFVSRHINRSTLLRRFKTLTVLRPLK
jgi:Lrp/AsnC family transcriptional regulator